jgi:speckle-type POZ protein
MKGVAHTNMFDSGFVSFKLHYSEAKDLAIGDVICSEVFSAGGHSWQVNCYPRGYSEAENEYISIFLELMSKSNGVKAIFDAFFMDKNGEPSSSDANRCIQDYPPKGYAAWGWPSFIKRSDLEVQYVGNGWATFVCVRGHSGA